MVKVAKKGSGSNECSTYTHCTRMVWIDLETLPPIFDMAYAQCTSFEQVCKCISYACVSDYSPLYFFCFLFLFSYRIFIFQLQFDIICKYNLWFACIHIHAQQTQSQKPTCIYTRTHKCARTWMHFWLEEKKK